MAKYAISEEGVSQLQKLSKSIISDTENIYEAGISLKNNISSLGEGLGIYENEIIDLVNHNQATLQSNREVFKQLSDSIVKKADEICGLMGFSSAGRNSVGDNTPTQPYRARRNDVAPQAHGIEAVQEWIGDINPNYHSPYFPPGRRNPYHINCGSCAFAVESRFNGNVNAMASSQNIGSDPAMEQATGKTCKYMSVEEIENILKDRGAGSHLIVGINRKPTPLGIPQSGHWFNAYYDGEKIYTVDGQPGLILGWPPDYGDISEWCALI